MSKNFSGKDKAFSKKIVIYQTAKGPKLEVRLSEETVWLSLDQMAALFERDKSVVSRHIRNVFFDKELSRKSVVANFATTAADGKVYQVDYYSLDLIISIGYRVKSQKGIQFRIWATKTLRDYLLKGYVINEKRLLQAQDKFKELQEAISFLYEKSGYNLLVGQEREIFDLLANYSKTLTLLERYDKDQLIVSKKGKGKFILGYEETKKVIVALKKDLIGKKEASDLFGQEYEGKLQGIIGNIYQTFGGKELYSSLEEKAAHLLYLIIKDHPLADGNKRTGSFLFVYFLDKNNFLYRESGEKKINDNALVALALLIAISNPKDKEVMIKIITNLLQ